MVEKKVRTKAELDKMSAEGRIALYHLHVAGLIFLMEKLYKELKSL